MSALYRGRRAASLENAHLRLTVLEEGGHIAELHHKITGVNPLWTPPWNSIEPSTYRPEKHPEYGADAESQLLSGIMGHNLCLDLFGPPSPEEAKAGLTVHGEASIVPYRITTEDHKLAMSVEMPLAGLKLTRLIELGSDAPIAFITETVENLSATDRPIAWTQHVTLGPPFLRRGETQFRLPGTRSRSMDGVEFDWPLLPREKGGKENLQTYTSAAHSGGYTAHLLDPHREQAYFLAYSPSSRVLCGYVWPRQDFPWLGIWEENHSRTNPPWNGKTLTRGMEFGASPIPESRRQMIERGSLFGVPGYRWLPARGIITVRYCAFVQTAPAIPEAVTWDGAVGLTFA